MTRDEAKEFCMRQPVYYIVAGRNGCWNGVSWGWPPHRAKRYKRKPQLKWFLPAARIIPVIQ